MRKNEFWKRINKQFTTFRKEFRKQEKVFLVYIRNKKVAYVSHIKFFFIYHSIRLKNRSIYWLRKHILNIWIGSLVYFLVIGIISFIAGWYIDISLLNLQALTYFITVAAMIGGIIAIVFSFKTLIMQNAAESTSVGFYRTLGKDKRQDVVFFILLFSVIIFFTLGLTASSFPFTLLKQQYDLLRILFQLSIFIIAFDLYLIFLLYGMLFEKIDPFSAISYLQKTSLKYIDDINVRATQFADLMMLHPKTDKGTTKEEMLASVFQSFRTDLQYLSDRLNYLFDYHDKVLSRNERTASLIILEVITSILKKYFIIRKDSSVLLPSGFFFVRSSDSQTFLTPHLESLVAVGENYLKREDAVGVRKIITLFQELVIYAGEIRFIGSTHLPENPILMQCRGYLDQFIKSVIQKNFFEGLYQGACTYAVIGTYIIRKKLIHEITPIYDMLDKIAYAGLLKKQDVVVTEVINTYSALITVLMEDYWLVKQKLDLILEHVQGVVLFGFMLHKTHTMPDKRMQQDLAKPYEILADLIVKTANKVSALKGRAKEEAKSVVLEATEELRISLRYQSDNMKNADHIIINSYARVIKQVGVLLIGLIVDANWVNKKRELENQASAYINQPWWFTYKVEKIEDNLNFDELTEAVSYIGLASTQENQDEIAKKAIEIITQFATEMLEKEAGSRFGFTEPRIMVLACYIGIYSLKLRKLGIVEKLKPHIKSFEEAYQKKWFSDPRSAQVTSPTKDQLINEVIQFMDNLSDYNRIPNPLEDTEEILLRLVTKEDVKKFIKEIWKIEVSDT